MRNACDPITKRRWKSVMAGSTAMQRRQVDITGKRIGRNKKLSSIALLIVGLSFFIVISTATANWLKLDQKEQQISAHGQAMQARILCKIARKEVEDSKRTNSDFFLYTSSKSRRQQITSFLLECLPQRPLQIFSFEDVDSEPKRVTYTLNFLLLPDDWSTDEGLTKLRQMLNAKQRRKPRHRYVFLWQQQRLDELFRLLWSSSGILHAVALNGTRMQDLYTYEPYAPQGFLVKPCQNLMELFYDKLKNLHGAQLKISMFEDYLRAFPALNFEHDGFSGVDGVLARAVVERLNATASYMLPTDHRIYGSCYENNTCTGVIADVAAERTHVAFNTRHTLPIEREFVEELYPFYTRKLALVVPAGQLLPESLIFKHAFTNNLWRLLLFIFCMACLAFYVLQRSALHFIGRSVEQTRLSVWLIIELIFKLQFGEPLPSFTRVSSLRLFIVSWILCCYVITSVYFAKMESNFVHEIYERDIDKIADFRQHFNATQVYISRDLYEVMSSNCSTENTWLLERAKIVERNISGYPYGLDIIKRTPNAAFVYRREITRKFLASTFNTDNHHANYHAMKQYVFSMPRSYIVPMGSPLRSKFNGLMKLCFQHGLLDHLLSLLVSNQTQKTVISFSKQYYSALGANSDGSGQGRSRLNPNLRGGVPLNAEILQGAFYLWWFGVILSFLAFLYECRCRRIAITLWLLRRRRKNATK